MYISGLVFILMLFMIIRRATRHLVRGGLGGNILREVKISKKYLINPLSLSQEKKQNNEIKNKD